MNKLRTSSIVAMLAMAAFPVSAMGEEVELPSRNNKPTSRKEKNAIAMEKAEAKRKRKAAKRLTAPSAE